MPQLFRTLPRPDGVGEPELRRIYLWDEPSAREAPEERVGIRRNFITTVASWRATSRAVCNAALAWPPPWYMNPQLLFLDEPTRRHRPGCCAASSGTTLRPCKDAGRTLFITTQYVGEAAYCDLVGRHGIRTPVDGGKRLTGLRRPRAYGGDVVMMKTIDPLPPLVTQDVRKFAPMCWGLSHIRQSARCAWWWAMPAPPFPKLLEWSKQQGLSVEKVEQ